MDTTIARKTLTVLLVEDNPAFARSAAQYLGLWPAIRIVGQALTDVQAIELAVKYQPDLVLLDISLGSATGFDVARSLSVLPSKPQFIFLTMHDLPAYREKARELGALGFVPKDQFVRDLMPIITGLLTGKAVAATGSSPSTPWPLKLATPPGGVAVAST